MGRADDGPAGGLGYALTEAAGDEDAAAGGSAGESGGESGIESSKARRVRVRPVDVGSTLGRYELVEELGAGGMATVYGARDTELRREVAVKVLFAHLSKRPEIVARFQREARAAAALDHPNIVRVYDVGGGEPIAEPGAEPGAAARAHGAEDVLEPPYLVMELVRGHSLHEVILDHSEALFAEIVACIGVVVCTALAEAHRAGIVHRDVKPGNIMVTASGRLALADFGVARIEDDDASLVTRTGALVGTPAFMSPEQAVGGDVDARSDIYSLGATLYRLATGMAPFSGPTARVVASIARGEHKSPLRRNPTMGVDLARIIERMMARDAGARYADCQAAAKALGEVVAAAGLGQPEKELAAFFADPVAYRAAYEPRVIRATLEQARRAARNRDATRAMALADRVVAMAPGEAEADEAMALVTSLGRSRTRVRIAAGALVAAVAIAAGVAAFADWGAVPTRGSETGDAALPDGGRDGMPGQVAVAVLAAGPVDAGRADARGHGDTIPAEVSKPVRDGSGKRPPDRPIHRPLYRPESGAARVADASVAAVDAATAAATAAAAPIVVAARPDAALARAGVKLDIRPWCDVRIGGDDYGRARRDRVISLLPGKHEIVCSQGPGRAEWRATVTLAPGEQKQLSGSVLRPVTITVAVTAGDRVVIDGRGYQNGVRLTLPPGRYRMDIKSGKRTVQGAWVAVPAVAACTVRDRPALDCYP